MTTSSVGGQDALYQEAACQHGAALIRLAHAYEADPEKRRDLIQDIHLALWRSLEAFDRRCSLRTWVYRVAHNAAATYVIRQKRTRAHMMVSLGEVEAMAVDIDRDLALHQLTALIQKLKPVDRQVIVSYLEGMDATAIGELTGISARHVATKVHRIKNILARSFKDGGRHGE